MTINHRGTSIPTEITAFSKEFIKVKQVQWAAFIKRLGQEHVPVNFEEIVTTVEAFLMPIVTVLTSNIEPPVLWQVSKFWK